MIEFFDMSLKILTLRKPYLPIEIDRENQLQSRRQRIVVDLEKEL